MACIIMIINTRIINIRIIMMMIKGAAATAVATCLTYPLQIVQARARVGWHCWPSPSQT